MSIIDSLKKIDFLRRWVKECKTLREYMIDAYSFNKYYMEKCDKNRNYDYHMLMLVHNIEKGMCMPYLRPFGEEKILMLINMISAYEIKNQDKDASVYKMAVSIVFQWKLFYEKHGWSIKSYEIVSTFINNHADIEKLDVGYEIKKFEELKLDAPLRLSLCLQLECLYVILSIVPWQMMMLNIVSEWRSAHLPPVIGR